MLSLAEKTRINETFDHLLDYELEDDLFYNVGKISGQIRGDLPPCVLKQCAQRVYEKFESNFEGLDWDYQIINEDVHSLNSELRKEAVEYAKLISKKQ